LDGGAYIGYASVTITSPSPIAYTTDGSAPACPGAASPAKFVVKKTAEVLAIACPSSGSSQSQVAAETILVAPASKVEITLSLGGSLTSADVTADVEAKLVSAIASTLGVDSGLVELVSVGDARRRLLALSVKFLVTSSSASDAQALLNKASSSSAALSSSLRDAGLELRVEGVEASVVASDEAKGAPGGDTEGDIVAQGDAGTSTSEGGGIPVAAVAGAAGGAVALVSALAAWWWVRRRRGGKGDLDFSEVGVKKRRESMLPTTVMLPGDEDDGAGALVTLTSSTIEQGANEVPSRQGSAKLIATPSASMELMDKWKDLPPAQETQAPVRTAARRAPVVKAGASAAAAESLASTSLHPRAVHQAPNAQVAAGGAGGAGGAGVSEASTTKTSPRGEASLLGADSVASAAEDDIPVLSWNDFMAPTAQAGQQVADEPAAADDDIPVLSWNEFMAPTAQAGQQVADEPEEPEVVSTQVEQDSGSPGAAPMAKWHDSPEISGHASDDSWNKNAETQRSGPGDSRSESGSTISLRKVIKENPGKGTVVATNLAFECDPEAQTEVLLHAAQPRQLTERGRRDSVRSQMGMEEKLNVMSPSVSAMISNLKKQGLLNPSNQAPVADEAGASDHVPDDVVAKNRFNIAKNMANAQGRRSSATGSHAFAGNKR